MYKCECGKEFESSQSFNGHKGHCKAHLVTKYDNVDKFISEHSKKCTAHNVITNKKRAEKNAIKYKETLQQWISEKHVCEHCGKIMTDKFGSGRFCCRSCANSHTVSEQQKIRTSKTITVHTKAIKILHEQDYYKNPKYCKCCNKIIPYELRKRVCCSDTCAKKLKKFGSALGGKKSATNMQKRSKNEIYFCELCERYFKNVRHNQPIFNNWDADIIIEDIKYAILWNGKWHYEQVFPDQNNSLLQIQTRDQIKINEIKKAGYIPYIIKDMGKHNKDFVEEQFNIFIQNCIIDK